MHGSRAKALRPRAWWQGGQPAGVADQGGALQLRVARPHEGGPLALAQSPALLPRRTAACPLDQLHLRFCATGR